MEAAPACPAVLTKHGGCLEFLHTAKVVGSLDVDGRAPMDATHR
jgi:hypothetical protein